VVRLDDPDVGRPRPGDRRRTPRGAAGKRHHRGGARSFEERTASESAFIGSSQGAALYRAAGATLTLDARCAIVEDEAMRIRCSA